MVALAAVADGIVVVAAVELILMYLAGTDQLQLKCVVHIWTAIVSVPRQVERTVVFADSLVSVAAAVGLQFADDTVLVAARVVGSFAALLVFVQIETGVGL